MSKRKTGSKCVILVHGLMSSPRAMKKIGNELSRNGYTVLYFGYDSRTASIDEVSSDLGRTIREEVPDTCPALHFVAHSLGSLVVRHYLSKNSVTNIGRFVMVAPPNQGSVWGRTLVKNIPALRYLLGPSVDEIQYSGRYRPPTPPPCEFGIISGGTGRSRGLNPLIPGDNDATVAVSETLLEGMKDHVIVNSQHTLLLFNKRVIDNIISFLATGKFIY
jgi:pimeloyl-ACP methyl ester carboxylesterase